MIKLNTTFALGNLKNLDVFPEKPNLLKAETVPDEAEMEEAKELLNTLCSVKDTGALPNEKYDMPMTSSQEVGFRYKPFVPVNPMFHKPRGSCEITRYADAYYHTTGSRPSIAEPPSRSQSERSTAGRGAGTRGERVRSSRCKAS